MILYALPGIAPPAHVKNLAGLLHFQLYQHATALDRDCIMDNQVLANQYFEDITEVHHNSGLLSKARLPTFKDHSMAHHTMRDRIMWGEVNTEASERSFRPLIRTPLKLSDGINKVAAIVRMVQRKHAMVEANRVASLRARTENFAAIFGERPNLFWRMGIIPTPNYCPFAKNNPRYKKNRADFCSPLPSDLLLMGGRPSDFCSPLPTQWVDVRVICY